MRANTINDKEKTTILQLCNDSLNPIKESIHNCKKEQEAQSEVTFLENKSLSEDISFLNLKLNKIRALLTTFNISLNSTLDLDEFRNRDNLTSENFPIKREKCDSRKVLNKYESRTIFSSVSSDKYKPNSLIKPKQTLRLDNSCGNIRLPIIQVNKVNSEHIKSKSYICQEKHNNLIEVCRSLEHTYLDIVKQMDIYLNTEKNSHLKMSRFREFSKKIKEVYELLIFNKEKLIFANEGLEETNSNLSAQINEFQSIHNKERFCLHCHSTFRMSNNQEVMF